MMSFGSMTPNFMEAFFLTFRHLYDASLIKENGGTLLLHVYVVCFGIGSATA